MDAVSLSGKAKLDGPIGHQEESAVAESFGDQRQCDAAFPQAYGGEGSRVSG